MELRDGFVDEINILMNAAVYNNGMLAGLLEKRSDGTYSFEYDIVCLQNEKNPSV